MSRRKLLPPRALHLPGKRPRIESDPELLAFIEEGLEWLTFYELEAACLERFGRPRAPSRSSLHRYWTRRAGEVRESRLRIGRVRRAVSGRLTVQALIQRLARSRLREGAVVPLTIDAGPYHLQAALVIVRLADLRHPGRTERKPAP